MDKPPLLLITGTSRGIGLHLAEYFIRKGYQVAGCSRGPSSISSEFYHHQMLDIRNDNEVRQWVRALKKKFKAVDILVSNAGIAPAATLMSMTSSETLENTFQTNVFGSYFICREVSKWMMQHGFGRIITISSMAVGLHEEGTSAYSASKSAIVEMTKVLAKEVSGVGITCNVIAPSMYKTEAVEILGEKIIERALSKLTIPRILAIEEIARVVEFLGAPESGAITGQVIHLGLVT
jgi:3-oxoacyl-[acyl-carrier protein] reductase